MPRPCATNTPPPCTAATAFATQAQLFADTFNFTVFEVSKNGKTLTVKSVGMNSTQTNAGLEYDEASPARTILSFKIRAHKGHGHDDGDDDDGREEGDSHGDRNEHRKD